MAVSSLYDGGTSQPAKTVIPTVLESIKEFYHDASLKHLVGSSVAGCISSTVAERGGGTAPITTSCATVELEGIPSVSIMLAMLPDVELQTFSCGKDDVPDDVGRRPANEWKRLVGLLGFGEESPNDETVEDDSDDDTPVFFLLPSPAFSTELEDLLLGLSIYFPGSETFGGVASTVSSLSRAKLYLYSELSGIQMTYTDGCVGIAMRGDIQLQSLSAQGAKPVGGIYQIVKGSESSIQAIVLDEDATAALDEEISSDEDEDEDEDGNLDARARMALAYAKARIPKPPLAEANFLMRTLSDDDQAFMRRQLLVGIERGGSIGRSANELARLASGEGHRFRVFQVASAGMKDGSVTFALGSVEIKVGRRVRFFVRESGFAKREVEALWLGYKQRLLNEQMGIADKSTPPTSCCFLVPTLDRGSKFFLGKSGYESSAAIRVMPSVPCVTGFFANGVIGKVDIDSDAPIGVQGSASGYFLISSKSGRPVFSAAAAAAEKAAREKEEAIERKAQQLRDGEDLKRKLRAFGAEKLEAKAPRSDDGELILKRREVHSGRAMTVSTVEWSVAEKTALPTSALEGFMWEKETEVDRFRERVPLVNLVSQCRLSAADPTVPKPRDFIGPIKQAISLKGFVLIPECKRLEPTVGSLRRRYDIENLVKSLTLADAPAISVNCDGVLYGGSLEDLSKARQAASSAAVEKMSEDGVVPPAILASDLLLYPYQLYKLSLAGADAVNIVVGALPKKDLTYLIKIASSLKLQTLASVTSEVQLETLTDLPEGAISAVLVSNRDLEDFSLDMSGEQALRLLKSPGLSKLRAIQGDDTPVFVEGGVGVIERSDAGGQRNVGVYLTEIRAAGAHGCIIGRGLVKDGMESSEVLKELREEIENAN